MRTLAEELAADPFAVARRAAPGPLTLRSYATPPAPYMARLEAAHGAARHLAAAQAPRARRRPLSALLP